MSFDVHYMIGVMPKLLPYVPLTLLLTIGTVCNRNAGRRRRDLVTS